MIGESERETDSTYKLMVKGHWGYDIFIILFVLWKKQALVSIIDSCTLNDCC